MSKHIVIIQPVIVAGQTKDIDELLEVSQFDAELLISLSRARLATEDEINSGVQAVKKTKINGVKKNV